MLRYPRHAAAAIATALFFSVVLSFSSARSNDEDSRIVEVTAQNVLLVANKALPASARLASYYAEKRGVPPQHVCMLDVTTDETVTRECFNLKILGPIKDFLAESGVDIRCIVVFQGVPLGIADSAPVRERIFKLKQQIEGIKAGTFQGELAVLEERLKLAEGEAAQMAKRTASVDSELALLGREHPLEGSVENPFMTEEGWPEGCYWVSRLDATDEADVKRMIDGALAAEEGGLRGIAYFDSRGLSGDDAYATADEEIRQAAVLTRNAGLATVVDDREELFGPGDCPEAALYWGWYSLAKYVDAFEFKPGAVAVHIASGEAASMREGEYWCRNLIANGAAVTLGPTSEPYLGAFPKADDFVEMILEGESVGQAYYETAAWLSWRMVLLGDPLYRPFGKDRRKLETHQK